MKNLLINSILMLFCTVLMAQTRVALHSGNNVSIFGGNSAFIDAYNAAIDGDLIYLPGGNLNYPPTIDKSLTIIGVGHYPEATAATNKTVLTGNLNIGENADGLNLEGIHVTGQLGFLSNEKADFVSLRRNRFGSILYNGNGTNPCASNVISECVIDGNITASNADELLITNSIISGGINTGVALTISNNIFTYNNYVYSNLTNSIISNNIHFKNSSIGLTNSGTIGNTFLNNIFKTVLPSGSNTFINNYTDVDLLDVFESVPNVIFDYNQNYNLSPDAQTNYLGADGTQVGIYGGLFPYKLNAVPRNPSITSKNISSETNADGELPVQVMVEAQNN